jgi:hypothetical protein
MSERLTVLWKNQNICCYDLVDGKGQYKEEVRHELRLASQAGELVCPDCGQRMVLCAGAIRQPYFRHFELQNCMTSISLKTKAGQRSYECRRALYHVVKAAGFSGLCLEESKGTNLMPVLFESEAGRIGYVYMDGKTRDYRALEQYHGEYHAKKIRLYYFLNEKFRSKAVNLTSDEAECAKLNDGEIYYMDMETECVRIRKKYRNRYDEVQYYEEVISLDVLCPDHNGTITQEFLERFDEFLQEDKRKFDFVKRFPAEEGIDEVYFEMDYVLMDSIGEVWVLPRFLYETAEAKEHKRKRIAYLEQQNELMYDMDMNTKLETADDLALNIAKYRNSWNWEI